MPPYRSSCPALIVLAWSLACVGPTAGQTRPDTTRDGFFHQYAPGLLARVNYQSDSTGPYRVAIWDLLVGPGKRMETPLSLPGGAVFEVRSGTGRIELDGTARELRAGSTFAVHQGTRFVLINAQKEVPLALRVSLIAAGRP
jgi:hypothetical protein